MKFWKYLKPVDNPIWNRIWNGSSRLRFNIHVSDAVGIHKT